MQKVRAINDLPAPFPLVDADPVAGRVIRYMRPSDYGTWVATTAAMPAAIYAYQLADPMPTGPKGLRPTLKLATFLGFAGGFLLAYQSSSLRLWGWKENAIEVERDQSELSKLASEGKPLYGETTLSPYIQGVSHRNSVWSQLKFSVMPWFNFVNHEHHGVDTTKYSK
ncbi:NADH:ubiquinone oxidoreductase 21kD subunit [Pseudohyphozyma bogoriensis]|nr:NADH:ubiquinone oxidoreductase 21kD subunit [Pseudohyphozyma bogoriensis]